MPLFDAYLFVDWSARNSLSPAKPSKDAIWVGELTRSDGTGGETYWRGREQATAYVRDRLLLHAESGHRVLVGFDFPYGYPAGLAAALGLGTGSAWRAIWDLLGGAISDDAANVSNRFQVASELNARLGSSAGPFWGRPRTLAVPGLTATKSGLFQFPFAAGEVSLARLRLTESETPGVQESWQLMYNGSVGSQALLGIPRVRALRDDPVLSPISSVWPFETGFSVRRVPAEGPFILHAEIWPGITGSQKVDAEQAATGAIRDEAQVRLMCRWAAERDDEGVLGERFAAPAHLSEQQIAAVVAEEGWILS
jgi:hypothetical protein